MTKKISWENKRIPLSDLIPADYNPRKLTENQAKQLTESIKRFDLADPIIVNSNMTVIGGHQRIKILKEQGVTDVDVRVPDRELTTDAERELNLRLNKNLGEWDFDLLGEFDKDMLLDVGFDSADLDKIFPVVADPKDDEIPETDKNEFGVVRGDIWQLGRHRIMCGDSTSVDDVGLLMDGKKAALCHADPPYGMGKENDGVQNDNLYADKLDAFQMEWWVTFRIFLEDNASAYIWGNAPELWRLWYQGGLSASERMTLRNQIVWNKKHGQGMSSEDHRMFPTATEHCLFFMLGEQGFNNNADNYWEGFEPIRAYLDNERKKMGWNNKTVAAWFGFHPRMADHWFSKSQWSFPQKEQYEKLQEQAKGDAFKREHDDLKREHDDLKREHDDLKREFYATRAYFNNTHDNMTDVWEFPRVTGGDRHGHATPKPVAAMVRAIKSSCPDGGIVAEPFLGSGSTLIACEKTNRICYGMEIDEHYCSVIIKRWQEFTGHEAKRV